MTYDQVVKLLSRPTPCLKLALLAGTTLPAYDVVYGAGGIKGYAELGAEQAIREHGLRVRIRRGCSVGSGNATYFANGSTPLRTFKAFERGRARTLDSTGWLHLMSEANRAWFQMLSGNADGFSQMVDITHAMQKKVIDTAAFWQRALVMPNFMQWMKSQSFISLENLWAEVIDQEGLLWTPDLEIVAYCVRDGEPLILNHESNIPLAKAIAGSGSVPGVFVPVEWDGHLLGDGAMFHYNPVCQLEEPAIVIRLGRATEWPSEPLTPMDMYFHWREMHLPMMPTTQDVDTNKHVVIDVPCKRVAGLSFGAGEAQRFDLIREGYEVAYEVLAKAKRDGRLVGACS